MIILVNFNRVVGQLRMCQVFSCKEIIISSKISDFYLFQRLIFYLKFFFLIIVISCLSLDLGFWRVYCTSSELAKVGGVQRCIVYLYSNLFSRQLIHTHTYTLTHSHKTLKQTHIANTHTHLYTYTQSQDTEIDTDS